MVESPLKDTAAAACLDGPSLTTLFSTKDVYIARATLFSTWVAVALFSDLSTRCLPVCRLNSNFLTTLTDG
jgi:hypothetical protein